MTERYAMDVLMYIIIHEWKVSSKALLIAVSIYTYVTGLLTRPHIDELT